MKELLAAVISENEEGNFSLAFHLDDPSQQTERVEKLIHMLMQARAGMLPPVSQQRPQPGEVHEAIFGSGWWIDPDLAGDLALRLHHPALGWLSWHLPKAAGRDLASAMLQILDRQEHPPSSVQ